MFVDYKISTYDGLQQFLDENYNLSNFYVSNKGFWILRARSFTVVVVLATDFFFSTSGNGRL